MDVTEILATDRLEYGLGISMVLSGSIIGTILQIHQLVCPAIYVS
jgi:hypothetical protein